MMETRSMGIACIVLAAGHGTRMRSSLPKVLHPIGGRPMLGHCLDTARSVGAQRIGVVIGAGGDQLREALPSLDAKAQIAVQDPPRGTGDAVKAGLPLLDGFEGTVLVLYGDTPLITAATLRKLCEVVDRGAGVAVLGFDAEEPGPYGRLILGDEGLERIVEAKEASEDELAVSLCNSGVMAVASPVLRALLPKIGNENAKGEYYLTDLVALAREAGIGVGLVIGDEEEVLGVNDRSELAAAEVIFQDRTRQRFLEDGVTLLDPSTVYFSWDTEIEPDCVIGQNVVFGPGVRLESGVTVKPFSHLEGTLMRSRSAAGPFARLREGTDLGEGAKVGNFVETKKAKLGPGVKAGHLSYLGDATIGAETNIGAGTITCNYDGYGKHKTMIGKNAFIGSNTMLVAPVTIGEGAFTGSGSVITKDVGDGALAVARGRQFEKAGWAISFRRKHEG
ncbi:MAG: bifunctional UDP-N-acetylglucosamine diphosphorylase/glucosamine-1-phosphate N-acetyltransferase GlmU [Parvularcula sp.]|jgi:bifunctional UDP-N-acetylglucosamine pyrophosphorylase/glucosamine-1-phosphate N-acetyltransferase|nr:bifunctional UDP-N-acetylglucosamine diphosphorylase/glucosamine-1-phosphate N-acetyltransferase GlmU [Parvularcula sp.]